MNYAITVELQFFLVSVLSGVIILLVYDCLRILRRLIKHDGFFIALEDLIFWVCASLFIFAMMYKENDGIIRGFAIMGMAIGMVIYHFALSDFIVNTVTKFIQTLISPIVFVLKKIIGVLKLLLGKGKKVVNFIIRQLKKCIKSVRITLNSRKQASLVKRKNRLQEKMLKKQQKDEKKSARKNSAKQPTKKTARHPEKTSAKQPEGKNSKHPEGKSVKRHKGRSASHVKSSH